ncbi:MAG: hypothetical protein BGP25_05410 [Lysobacterales bacterium 63-13]|nr:MAG: hypothetical protein BGP25_05410 [Xanthomonadales bacterium 63-13]
MSAPKPLEQRWTEYAANNRALRTLVLGLITVNVVLVFMLAFRSEIITINPPDPKGIVTYERTRASEDALTSWGLYIATLLGNVSPKNAQFVSNSVGQILAPEIYQDVMRTVAEQAKAIEMDQLTLRFEPAEVKFDPNRNAVYVVGWLSTQDAHGSTNRVQRTYEMWWKVVNYQPRLVGLNAYAGAAQLKKN